MTLKSPWTDSVDLNCPLNEYPRMQLRRGSFFNLNGEWEYTITHGEEPSRIEGWKKIIVPFALGSQLSGTSDELRPGEVLWYRRRFVYHPETRHTYLNFEAVDQVAEVWLNGLKCGEHEGGYAPFSFDVSQMIKENNEILVRVTDDSDTGIYAYGKQKIEHSGMWYTPSGGIWQTVWLEDVPDHAVTDIKITPDYDAGKVYLRMAGTYTQAVITVFEGNKLVHRGITGEKDYTITLDRIHAWSVSDPFLYDLYIQTEDETVKSYFGMRRFTKMPDSKGKMRFALNGKPLFLSGVLDQGYSVDGLMTYPCEEAMLYELKKIKDMGFNFIRKHVKVECRRWYYLCDLLGILVMQDMPSGGNDYKFSNTAALPTIGMRKMKDEDSARFGRASAESRQMYLHELDEMLDNLYNVTSIFAWVPFNEGWGQFDSAAVTNRIKSYDTTRLVDSASGWHDQGAGDFASYHCYFRNYRGHAQDGRIELLSEFGGYTYIETGHSEPKELYGYKKYKDRIKLSADILSLFETSVLRNIEKGLAGSIYTQVSDVEDECNGLFTADRKVIKVDEKKLKKMNERCIRSVK